MPSNEYDLVGELPAKEEIREWIFTFGCGQENAGCYTSIHGTFNSAREKMFTLFGDKWSMQYRTEEEAGVERWKLKRIYPSK